MFDMWFVIAYFLVMTLHDLSCQLIGLRCLIFTVARSSVLDHRHCLWFMFWGFLGSGSCFVVLIKVAVNSTNGVLLGSPQLSQTLLSEIHRIQFRVTDPVSNPICTQTLLLNNLWLCFNLFRCFTIELRLYGQKWSCTQCDFIHCV